MRSNKKPMFSGEKNLSQRIGEIAYDEEVLVGVAKDIDKQVKTGKMNAVSEKELRKKL